MFCVIFSVYGSGGARIFRLPGHSHGHQNLDWGTFEKLCVPSLFLVEASTYTVRTNGSTHGRNCRKPCYKKTFCKTLEYGHWL